MVPSAGESRRAAQQATTCSNRGPARLDGMARPAGEIGVNRSADFAAACPSQQPAGDPTTKLAVAGGPRFRIHLSPAERHVQRGALRAAARGLGQRPQERDRWFESGSLQGRVRCELVQKKRRSFTHKMSPARSRPAVESKIFETPPLQTKSVFAFGRGWAV